MNRVIFAFTLVAGVLQNASADPVSIKQGSVAGASVSSPETHGSRIAFDQTLFDFGKVEAGELIKHTFFFTNTGNQILEVREVRPSCGCTTAGEWDKQVEPGKYGKIPIQYNSAGNGGVVHKSVTVVCTDPSNSNAVLQIIGTVWKPIDVSPPMASFNFGPDVQSNEVRVLHIINNLPEPLALSEVKSGNPAVFQPELKTIKEGKEYELRVTVVPPRNMPTMSTPITLKTSYAKMPVLSVTAFAAVQSAISAMPVQVMLPAGPLTNSTQFTVVLQNNSTNSVVLSEPKANVEGVQAKLTDIQPGRRFELNIIFPSEFQSPSGQAVEISVKSNFPQLPVVKVPVYQAQAAPKPAAASTASHAALSHTQVAIPGARAVPGSQQPSPSASP